MPKNTSRVEDEAAADVAWAEMGRALQRAQETCKLRDMVTAVRAFESFVRLAGLSEEDARQVLGQ